MATGSEGVKYKVYPFCPSVRECQEFRHDAKIDSMGPAEAMCMVCGRVSEVHSTNFVGMSVDKCDYCNGWTPTKYIRVNR